MLLKFQVAMIMVAGLIAFGQNSSDQDQAGSQVVWEPPASAWSGTLPTPSVPKEMIKELKVAGWRIVLEETELIAAQKRFGGTIGSRGDAGDALGWLCLYRREKGASWVLWLESSETDAGKIGGFRWEQLPAESTVDTRCQKLSSREVSVDLPQALDLGMKDADVVEKLGQPSVRAGDSMIYVHEHDFAIRSTPYTLSNDVKILLRDGKVWAIDVVRSTVS
jgi:hypothetical protein